MKRGVPFGFWVAGCFSAWFGVTMVIVLMSMDPGSHGIWGSALGRGAAGLLAAMAAVVTEALWRARPWAWRASLAMTLVYVGAVLAVFGSGRLGRETTTGIVLGSCTVLVPLLAYIRYRSRQLWPPSPRGSVRVTVPPAQAGAPGARP